MSDDIARYKVEEVRMLTELMDSNPVIGVVSVEGIPGPQLSKMRATLRGKAVVKVTKRTILRRALENVTGSRPGLDALGDHMDGQMALIATRMNPFRLNRMLEGTITPTPAKGGETAPDDITIAKGDTEFKPGPIVGEFQKAGIPAAIEGGRVVVKRTVTPVRKGEPIPRDLALMLTKLRILPMEVGLSLRALYEDGVLYDPATLHIDPEATRGSFASAGSRAFNLAMFAHYPTSLTAAPLLQKGHREAMSVALFAGVVTPGTASAVLGRAHGQMLAVASAAGDGLDDELRGMLEGRAAASAAPVPAAPAGDGGDGKKEEEEEEEEEEVSEEEAAGGLGALFG